MITPNRTAFTIAGLSVYWYGILIATALLLGTLLGMRREARLGLKKDTSLNFILLAVPVCVVCARLYYVVFSFSEYRDNLLSVFNLREGGLAIYGAVIGGFLAAWFYARHAHIRLGTLCDLCAPCLALGQAIGRWGNFFNQEAYGVLTENPGLRFFPVSVYIEAYGEWHLAAFFYESVWCLLIVGILLFFEHRNAFSRPGDEFCWYAAVYALERSVVEGMRMDSLMLGSLRISQVLAWACVLAVGVRFFLQARKRSRIFAALLLLCWAGGLAAILAQKALLLPVLCLPCLVLLILVYRTRKQPPAAD